MLRWNEITGNDLAKFRRHRTQSALADEESHSFPSNRSGLLSQRVGQHNEDTWADLGSCPICWSKDVSSTHPMRSSMWRHENSGTGHRRAGTACGPMVSGGLMSISDNMCRQPPQRDCEEAAPSVAPLPSTREARTCSHPAGLPGWALPRLTEGRCDVASKFSPN